MYSYPASPQQPVPRQLWAVTDAMPADAWVPGLCDQGLDKDGKPSFLPIPLPMAATHLPAGFPSPAEDFSVRRHDLNELLITHPLATFLWKVSGTSMVDAGIFDGDIVVVNRALTPVHKDVVVAEVDGEFTIKHLYKRLGRVKLVPANPTFPEITFKDGQELRICGVVTSTIKRFRKSAVESKSGTTSKWSK